MAAIRDLTFVWTSVAPAAVAWLLTFAIHSTLLVGLVWLVSRCVRSHRLKDVLWKAALVGGILTTTLQVALGLEPLAGRFDLSSSPAPVLLSQDRGGIASEMMPQTPGLSAAGPDLGREPAEPPASGVIVGSNAGERTTWQAITLLRNRLSAALRRGAGWLFGFWLLGAAVASLRFGLARWRLCASLGRRRDISDGSLTDMLTRLRRIAGLPYPVRLTCSPHAASPMLLKAREICLPQRAITQLSAEQQRSLLAHELAHVVRHDPLWLTVVGVLGCLFFFQPLFRLSRRRMRECGEYLCDDLAAQYTDSGLSLARCLVEVARWLPSHTRPAAVAGMAENISSLERRIRRLLDGSQSERSETPRWWWATVVVGVLVLVGVAGPGVSATAGGTLPAVAASVEERSAERGSPWEVVSQTRDEAALEEGIAPHEVLAWSEWNGKIRVSPDGGQSWQIIPHPKMPYPITFASFIDTQTGWAASSVGPSLWATCDGGKTWTEIALPEGTKGIAAIQLRAASDGYLLSTTGVLYVTWDRGASWSSQALALNREPMFIPVVTPSAAVHFSDGDHGLVVVSLVGGGRGEVLAMRTEDGGHTWEQESVPVESGTLCLANNGATLKVEGWSGRITVLRYRGS